MRPPQHELLELLESAGPRLHALLIRLTLRPDVAEELMQELFINLSQSRGFVRAENPQAYAFRAAMNLAFQWRRAQSRRLDTAVLSDRHEVNTPSPLAALLADERARLVLDALDRLPPLQRSVVVMRYIQQDSYEAIAACLAREPAQLRALCHKGIVSLRRLVGDEDATPEPEGQSNVTC